MTFRTIEMRAGVVMAFILLIAHTAVGEIISPSRKVAWQGNVGVAGGIPNRTTIYTTIPAGASLGTVQAAIKACPANQVVKLSAGDYVWSGTLDWYGVNNGVVLRGAGRTSTTITFTGAGGPNCIYVRSPINETALLVSANLSSTATKGASTVSLASVPSWVTVGKLIGLDQNDDSSFVSGGGTEGGSGYRQSMGTTARGLAQLNRVTAKTSTTITLETPLYYGFATAQAAQIFEPFFNPSSVTPLTGCGIEDLTLVGGFTDGSVNMIKFEATDSCWVKNVTVNNHPGGIAILLLACYRNEVRHCEVRDARAHGGGQGYAISLFHFCSGCLIEDNILTGYHIATGAAFGSSGNVYAYNFMTNGVADSTQYDSMSTHGVHCYMNLWEGNWASSKLLADWTHGSSSHNTAYRNRITGAQGVGDQRACVSIEYYNRYWNIVGNILGTSGLQNKYLEDSTSTSEGSQGSILKIGGEVNINNDFSPSDADSYTSGSFILIHGNYDTVTASRHWDPNVADQTLLPSQYLSSKPLFFGNLTWPPFDPLNPSGIFPTNIPAGYRYVFGVDPPAGPVNLPPIARASASSILGLPPLPVIFSSAGSSDPEGAALTYSWNFGDGTAISTLASLTHTYLTAGTFSAQLTVSDGTNSASTNITILVGNQPPVAVVAANPTSGTVPLPVAFSSAGSSDVEGAALSFNWNFGDGSANSTLANPTHTYTNIGVYTARLIVSDGAKSATNSIIISVVNPSTGLVAAYGFEEGSGTVLTDLSGNGNNGAITGGIWTTGRYGKALSFDGASSMVTVSDSASLHLSTAMTLSAWVYPTSLGGWRDIIYKADDIYFLEGSTPAGPPCGGGTFGPSLYGTNALPLNWWSHLAVTWDGATVRFYLDGVQVASRAQTGTIFTSTNPVMIGGDTPYGQYWAGKIDEVRIYNRALSAAQVLADKNTSVTGQVAPGAPPNPRYTPL